MIYSGFIFIAIIHVCIVSRCPWSISRSPPLFRSLKVSRYICPNTARAPSDENAMVRSLRSETTDFVGQLLNLFRSGIIRLDPTGVRWFNGMSCFCFPVLCYRLSIDPLPGKFLRALTFTDFLLSEPLRSEEDAGWTQCRSYLCRWSVMNSTSTCEVSCNSNTPLCATESVWVLRWNEKPFFESAKVAHRISGDHPFVLPP